MLHLAYETPAAWAQAALADPRALLLDQYFCEVKAAAAARSLKRWHGGVDPRLGAAMDALAKEEDGHASQCRKLLKNIDGSQRPPGNPYVRALRTQALGSGDGTLLDPLLVSAMIEARSAERFRLLAEACRGSSLGNFYEDLFAAESRHHARFVALACDRFGESAVRRRLRTIASIEAKIVSARPWGPHIH